MILGVCVCLYINRSDLNHMLPSIIRGCQSDSSTWSAGWENIRGARSTKLQQKSIINKKQGKNDKKIRDKNKNKGSKKQMAKRIGE